MLQNWRHAYLQQYKQNFNTETINCMKRKCLNEVIAKWYIALINFQELLSRWYCIFHSALINYGNELNLSIYVN
jgi:hypothetical protein